MPAPEPTPLEGGPSTIDKGSPVAIWGNWSCGGPTTVGSAVNLGLLLRTTTAGGVVCSVPNLWGSFFEAVDLSSSPPSPSAPHRVAGLRRMDGPSSVTARPP